MSAHQHGLACQRYGVFSLYFVTEGFIASETLAMLRHSFAAFIHSNSIQPDTLSPFWGEAIHRDVDGHPTLFNPYIVC